MKLTVIDRLEHTGVSVIGEPLPAEVAELVMFRCLVPAKDRHVTAGVHPSAIAGVLDARERTLDSLRCAFLVGGWPEEWVAAESLTD
jgi:hypothetical protein